MTVADFRRWLAAYGRAWEARDPDAAAALFTEDAVYEETPFSKPLRGREAIREYWAEVPRSQEDIRFTFSVLAWAGGAGVAHWRTTLVRTADGARIQLDGVLVATFDHGGLCRHFREWWHRQEGSTR